MKRKKLIFIMAVMITAIKAQPPIGVSGAQNNWFRGGNNGIGSGGGGNINNIFGTDATFNSSVWHQTFGVNHMIMDNNTNTGRVGIGDALPNNFAPSNRIHVHQTNTITGTYIQFTNINATGGANPPSNSGLFLGVDANVNSQINLYENRNINIFSGGTGGTSPNVQRMQIAYETVAGYQNEPRVRIGANNAFAPLSYLHLGGFYPKFPSNGGNRAWMNVGTFCSSTFASPDNMYIGMKDISNDLSDEVIAFGDNPTNGLPYGTGAGDRLRFIFTGISNGTQGSTVDGLEMGRMLTVEGTNPRTGIGNFLNGGGSGDPGNTLEIKSSPSSAYWPNLPGGPSGLRFSFLTSANAVIANGTNGANDQKVLTVDQNGDVVLIKPNGGSSLGNICGGTPNPLATNWEIPTGGFNFHFNELLPGGKSEVGIGLNACANTLGKFEVLSTAGNGGTKQIACYGQRNASFLLNYEIGTAGAIGNPVSTLSVKPIGTTIGVYGYNPTGTPPPNIYNWAGYFDGHVNINGDCYATSHITTSDKRFKKNINSLENVFEKISKIKGYTYEFKTEEFKEKGFSRGSQIGFIAQELQEVFPELVKEGESGFLGVNYQGMIPVLLEAIKADHSTIESQQQQITDSKKLMDDQQKQIDELKTMVQSLAGNQSSTGSKSANSQAVSLSDKNAIILNQNVPNPFAESTVITYNIPNDFTKAQIIFNTNDGKIIKTVDVTSKGQGSLNVFANDLSSGMYSYSLIVDGKVVDTKKMIKD